MSNDWFINAACYGSYDHRFHGTIDDQRRMVELYCLDCPVRAECRDYRDRMGEKVGTWGGKTGRVGTDERLSWKGKRR